MKRRKKSGGGGASWMDTYGDMVTLLLCFFVLLYSISQVDQSKWIALVQSFNPNAIQTSTETTGNDGPSADPEQNMGTPGTESTQVTQQEIDTAMEELYQALKTYVEQKGAEQTIEVSQGDGYVFVSFNEAVFFDGDSYILREDGKAVLTQVAEILSQAAKYVDEVRVMGHTAQARADTENNIQNDRFLASNRATVALVYIQENCTLDPGRLVSEGYGQWRPVGDNKTSDGRAQNRRVEIMISGLDLSSELGDSVKQYYGERGSN